MAVQGHASQRPKADPSVVVPEAVRRAAARSEELVAQQNGAKPPVTPASNVVITSLDPNTPKPEANATPPNASPKSFTPINETVTTPPNVANGENPPAPEIDYKHQFESTKGRLQREQEEKARLAQHNADLQQLLASLSVPVAPPPNVGGGDVRFGGGGNPAQRRITQKEIDEFGPELIDMIGRRAEEIYAPVVTQLQQEVAQLRGQVGGVRNAVAQDHMSQLYKDLSTQIPNWMQINEDPQFLSWLSLPDDLSGLSRKQLLTDAFKNGQTARVAAAFRGFQAYQAANGPVGGEASASGNGGVTPGVTPSTPQLDLASLAAPGRAKSGQTQVPPEKPIFNRADITEFYKDKTLGKWQGREDEALAIEQAVILAGKEGRIR